MPDPVATVFGVPNGGNYGFMAWLPSEYDDVGNEAKTYPMIIFLSGAGHEGNGTWDGTLVYNASTNALPLVLDRGPIAQVQNGYTSLWDGESPAILIQPQTASNWGNAGAINSLITALKARFRVDNNRVHMTGYSNGGQSWTYAVTYGAALATLVQVCSTSAPTDGDFTTLDGTIVWGLHTTNDTTVSPYNTLGRKYPNTPVGWMTLRASDLAGYDATLAQCLDTNPDPLVTTGSTITGATATRSAKYNGPNWTWVTGLKTQAGAYLNATLINGGAHNAWDPTYGTAAAPNKAFWRWMTEQARGNTPTKYESSIAIDSPGGPHNVGAVVQLTATGRSPSNATIATGTKTWTSNVGGAITTGGLLTVQSTCNVTVSADIDGVTYTDTITVTGVSVMSVISNITGAAWPTSGAATPGTTGLNTITGGTHVGSTDVPPGSVATGYIRGPDDGALNVRIDGTSILTVNETEYWPAMWWRFARTATPLAADLTAIQFNIFQNAGTRLRTYFYMRNLAHAPGLGMAVQEFLSSWAVSTAYTVGNVRKNGANRYICTVAGTSAASGGPTGTGTGFVDGSVTWNFNGTTEGLFSQGSSGSPALVYFDRWVHLQLRITRSAANGIYEWYANGVLVARHYGLPTDGEVTAAQLQAQPNFSWPAIAGIRAEVCGPLTSHDGAGPALRPMHNLWPSTSLIHQAHTVDVASDVGNSNGKCWTYTGTATRTLSQYASSGSNPSRKRWTFSGAAASTWELKSIDAIGTPAYGPAGWYTIVVPMIYLPSGTANIIVRNAADSADLVTVACVGALLGPSWDVTDRHCVMIHFGNNGQIKVTLSNLSNPNTAVNAWSFDFPTWTPQDLGKIIYNGVLGASSTECDGAWCYRTAPVAGVDSLSHVMANTAQVIPNMAMVNHVSAALAAPTDAALIPDCAWPNRIYSMAARPIACVLGRAGETRSVFKTNVLDQMTHSRGLEIINIDGGSVNDLAVITDAGTQTAELNALQAEIETMCDQGVARGWIIWMTTMLSRPAGYFTAIQLASMPLYNARIRSVASAKSAGGNVYISDVSALIADNPGQIGGDFIHPTAAGSGEMAKQMALGRVLATAAQAAGARRLRGLGLGIGLFR